MEGEPGGEVGLRQVDRGVERRGTVGRAAWWASVSAAIGGRLLEALAAWDRCI